MAQFPSSLISFSTKVNGQVIDASDINSPQAEITALETKVGVDGSADTTSLDYLVKNAASDGGGHVQKANKGGTGQTSYTKGDLLVATSSSVLGKVGVGVNDTVLLADSTQTAGVRWANPPGSKISNSGLTSTTTTLQGSSSVFGSIMSVTIPASTLGTSGAIRTKVYFSDFGTGNPGFSILLAACYGNTRVSSVVVSTGAALSSVSGNLEYTIFSAGASNTQTATMLLHLSKNKDRGTFANNPSIMTVYSTGSASEDSSASKTLGIEVVSAGAEITRSGYTVERLI